MNACFSLSCPRGGIVGTYRPSPTYGNVLTIFASFFLRAVKRYVLIHLPGYGDKLEYILFMLRKLYAFAAGDCGVDNADSLQNQELLLPGHLMCTFVKEKFEETLDNIRIGLMKEMRVDYAKFLGNVAQSRWWTRVVDRYGMLSSGGVGKKVQHFLSTGNIISTTGLDLMQVSGYTIVAEKLNFLRFCAHFRSVHRGQFFSELSFALGVSGGGGAACSVSVSSLSAWIHERFTHTKFCFSPLFPRARMPTHCRPVDIINLFVCLKRTVEMKTTAVRKLLPDQWGFLCPVHTPDGGPCGLLSHLALKCQCMAYPAPTSGGELRDLTELLIEWGVTPTGTGGERGDGCGISNFANLPVLVDGRVVGGAPARLCKSMASQLRSLKVREEPIVPPTLEVAFIPPGTRGGPYPGLFLFTIAARVVRPVLQRATGRTEFIGPM